MLALIRDKLTEVMKQINVYNIFPPHVSLMYYIKTNYTRENTNGLNACTALGKSKSVVTHELYGRMSMNLVRANATAILSRSVPPPELQ